MKWKSPILYLFIALTVFAGMSALVDTGYGENLATLHFENNDNQASIYHASSNYFEDNAGRGENTADFIVYHLPHIIHAPLVSFIGNAARGVYAETIPAIKVRLFLYIRSILI